MLEAAPNFPKLVLFLHKQPLVTKSMLNTAAALSSLTELFAMIPVSHAEALRSNAITMKQSHVFNLRRSLTNTH
jgi:hypothetical protein